MNFQSLVKDLDSDHAHDSLRLLLDHPQLAANGWEIANKLVPFVRDQHPAAIKILDTLANTANAKEMIMSSMEVLSCIDHEESENQFVFVHYSRMYFYGKINALIDSIEASD
jgi:hypothetical protein